MPIRSTAERLALLLLALALVSPAQVTMESSAVQQAWALSDQARELARSRRSTEALSLYEQAIALAPQLAPIELDYGVALGWAGQYGKAVQVFRRIQLAQPDQPAWARLEMANAELFGGSASEAVVLFESLMSDGDLREPILTRRALALRRSGRRDDAAEAYRETLASYPDSETAALGIIECFLDRRRVAEAHTFIATWSEGRPRSAQILAWRGWLLARLHRFDESNSLLGAIPADAFGAQSIIVGRAIRERFQAETPLPMIEARQPSLVIEPPIESLPVSMPGVETGRPLTRQAQVLAAEGVALARAGSTQLGSAYLRRAIAMSPEHNGIRRDYAIVLTWSDRYIEARRQFDYVFRQHPTQPLWSRSDRAQAELFGGDPAAALEILNGMLAEGYVDEHNLVRKGLALRWSGNAKAAERLYTQIAALYPDSSAGPDGLIHSLADQNRLGSAIKAADSSLDRLPNHWDLVKSKAQVLNWAGRHLQAEKTLAAVPEDQAFHSDVLHHRALAARWSNDARRATDYAQAFVQRYPGDRDAYQLREALAYQYGYSLRTSADYFGDTDGFVSQGLRQEFEAPLSLRHRLDMGVNRQFFSQGTESARWTTYGLGWTGQLTRRLSTHASAGQVLYSGDGIATRLSLDSSASLLVSDRVRVQGGVGQAPTTAFHAVQQRVQTQYGYLETDLRPTLKTQVSGRFGITRFSGSTTRTSVDISALRVLRRGGVLRLQAGARSGWISHDQPSPLVYSPQSASSHLGVIHMEGRLPWQVDYTAEFGSGLQFESGSPRSIPLSSTVEIAKELQRAVWLRLQAGYSNSALQRTNAGGASYKMSYVSVQLDYRLKREF